MTNLSIPGFEIEPGALIPIASGFNSDVFKHHDTIVKISKRSRSNLGAKESLAQCIDEYNVTARYLGDTAVNTAFHIAEYPTKTGRFIVVTMQPFIEGVALAKAADTVNEDALKAMYDSALNRYADTGVIPDLACIEKGLFDARRSPNVIVTPEGNPKLVDPNSGKLQKSRVFGPIWNLCISRGVRRALYEM